MLYHFTQIDL